LKWIKEYRLIIMGAAALILLVIAGSGGRERQQPEPVRYRSAFASERRAPAAAASRRARDGRAAAGARRSEPAQQEESPATIVRKDTAAVEAPVDSTAGEEGESFDPEKARLKAVEEVREFNEKLASTLWSTNPNALKTRLKASELQETAEELDAWIKTQDARGNMTAQERQEWQAQREVWVAQSKQLKQVSLRLRATRGTKRKVHILAKEIKDRTER
jgi:hypothetical protein